MGQVGCSEVLLIMDYAMKSLSLFSPKSLSKCVSASASMTQQLLAGPATRPKPFRVANFNRSVKKGIMADGLRDLLNKLPDALHVSSVCSLVLEEDGTMVDTEEFFQTLDDNTVFVALDKGQEWTPSENGEYRLHLTDRPRRRKDVARITFDLYKTNPRDFIGCLNVKATLYGMYTVSYDLRCYGAKKMMNCSACSRFHSDSHVNCRDVNWTPIAQQSRSPGLLEASSATVCIGNKLREALRWTLFSMQATGHVLLGTSCYMQQLLDEEEQGAERKEQLTQPTQLQSILWGKTAV
ncbi:cell death activator CIDE-3-like isoform X2 [Polyodon spathula]|uniref:cell death activator CIDE-3-like isoform X2 n=1 Tax=Polyodon spathula TaxID=7913 RepID=UPI001B7DF5A6|nr:cell death activator CIDE-3-like isoform X2 [Polyodon spathula]